MKESIHFSSKMTNVARYTGENTAIIFRPMQWPAACYIGRREFVDREGASRSIRRSRAEPRAGGTGPPRGRSGDPQNDLCGRSETVESSLSGMISSMCSRAGDS